MLQPELRGISEYRSEPDELIACSSKYDGISL